MHVVKVRDAQPLRQEPPTSPISSCEWITSYRCATTRRAMVSIIRASSTILVIDGPMRTFLTKEDAATENAEIGELDIAADRIGHQVDVMAELTEGFDAVVLAEGRAARLEKRLGREHQDAHESLYLTEPMAVRLH